MKRTKVLITGSGGFIMGNFIRQSFFNKKTYTISSIDRVRDTHIIHNIYVNSDHHFYINDITDKHSLRVIFEKEQPDIVIHGAAETFPSETFVTSNVTGTQNIIEECLKHNSRLIYISSDKVYQPLISENEELHSDDSQKVNPVDMPNATKLAGEILVETAGRVYGLSNLRLRLGNVYGPWQTKDHLIPYIISQIINNKPVNIYGKGQHLRLWTHVYDIVKSIFLFIDEDNWDVINNKPINVTSKNEFSNLEVFHIIADILGKGFELLKFIEDIPENHFRAGSKSDLLRNYTKWTPEYKLKDGLRQTCQWYVNNKYVLSL